MGKKQQVGLSLEILFTILFITAVAMFLISMIAFNVMERIALDGKIEGLKSIVNAYEKIYFEKGKMKEGAKFLESTLEYGAWGVVSNNKNRVVFSTINNRNKISVTDPIILEVKRTGNTVIELKGFNLPPVKFHEGIKLAMPLKGKRVDGIILIYQPLFSLRENIISGQQQVAVWIILFLLVIALLSFYVLSRRIVKPVKDLIYVTEEIAQGEFPENLDIGNVRELNQLSNALKTMYLQIESSKSELKSNIEALEESNRVIQRTQKELVASEKLASLGRLSAGVAHEIGNPLSAILGYLEVMRRQEDTLDSKYKYLESIRKEALRIDRIIKTLLYYAKPKDFEIKNVNMNEIIRNSVDILEAQGVFKNVDLELKLDSNLKNIEADQHQISQVIINLLLNAMDAINEKGKIIISSDLSSDGRIEIKVIDNGTGIPEEHIDKIFDPFFTTKGPGKGTGLGLSVSARIVSLFGGSISVENNVDSGSTFKIIFT